jgi:isoleucyl-tRNA synthetase
MRQRVVSDPDGVELGNVIAARQDMFVAALRGRLEEAREEGEVILKEEQAVGTLVLVLQLVRV